MLNKIRITVGGEPVVFTEEEVKHEFSNAYDQDKNLGGYVDDDDFPEPFRHLKQWYLVKDAYSSPHQQQRLPLPSDTEFAGATYGSCKLVGWLQPRDPTTHRPILIELTDMNCWCIDRSKTYRGYWIMMDDSLYWLQEPDTSGSPSQEDLHLACRAQLGVLSNLMDFCFATLENGNKNARKSVAAVHKELTKQLGHEPFDKELLAQYKDFNWLHLVDSHEALTDECQFIKTLKTLRPKAGFDQDAIIKSTVAAEARSQQYPWGEICNVSLLEAEPHFAELWAEPFTIANEAELEQAAEDLIANRKASGQANNGRSLISKKKGPKSTSKNGSVAAAKKTKASSVKRGYDSVSSDEFMPLAALKKKAIGSAPRKKPFRTADKKSKARRQILEDTDSSDLEDSEDEDEAYTEGPVKKKAKLQKTKQTSKRRLTNGLTGASSKSARISPKVSKKKTASTGTSQSHKKPGVSKALSPAVDGYCSKRMKNALIFLRMYLTPPMSSAATLETWEDVQDEHYTILDVSKAKELLEMIEICDINAMDTEWLLLVVETFRQTCLLKKNDVVKQFFHISKGKVASVVFEDWRRHSMKLMEERLDRNESVDGTPELFLLVSILNFIADCRIVRKPKVLQTLKDRGVDWEAALEEISPLTRKVNSEILSIAFGLAKHRVERILNNEVSTKSNAQTAPLRANDMNPLRANDMKASAAPKLARRQDSVEFVGTRPAPRENMVDLTGADEQYKEERRKRILAMVSKASTTKSNGSQHEKNGFSSSQTGHEEEKIKVGYAVPIGLDWATKVEEAKKKAQPTKDNRWEWLRPSSGPTVAEEATQKTQSAKDNRWEWLRPSSGPTVAEEATQKTQSAKGNAWAWLLPSSTKKTQPVEDQLWEDHPWGRSSLPSGPTNAEEAKKKAQPAEDHTWGRSTGSSEPTTVEEVKTRSQPGENASWGRTDPTATVASSSTEKPNKARGAELCARDPSEVSHMLSVKSSSRESFSSVEDSRTKHNPSTSSHEHEATWSASVVQNPRRRSRSGDHRNLDRDDRRSYSQDRHDTSVEKRDSSSRGYHVESGSYSRNGDGMVQREEGRRSSSVERRGSSNRGYPIENRRYDRGVDRGSYREESQRPPHDSLESYDNERRAGRSLYVERRGSHAVSDQSRLQSIPMSANPSSTNGRGRGRGRTLPAWMTRDEAYHDSAPAKGEVPGGAEQPPPNQTANDRNNRCDGPQNVSADRGQTNGPVENQATLPTAEAGVGRGRGRGRVLPAWMTRNSQVVGTHSVNHVENPSKLYPVGSITQGNGVVPDRKTSSPATTGESEVYSSYAELANVPKPKIRSLANPQMQPPDRDDGIGKEMHFRARRG